jgi:phosphoglycolate phosphatase-like HAD superfamily hydrolase
MERDELEAAGAHVVVESFAELAERLGWSDGGDEGEVA